MTSRSEPPIIEVFRHHLWANLSLFRFCETLTPDQLRLTVGGTYGTVYDTLLHIAVGEQWYVADLSNRGRTDPIGRGERLDGVRLTQNIERSGEALIEVAGRLTRADYARWSDRGKDESMLAVRLAIQALDHATEHRTHIRTTLSEHGVEPPELDGWAYDAVSPDKGDYLDEGARNG